MALERLAMLCAMVTLLYVAAVLTQEHQRPFGTRFTCHGRAAGYYADVDTGCQVYHMCDGLGRQFSYTCPNTTLFQQRMLICDHWYMVNCSMSERDYSANLLIGQRDKPFVSEEEMRLRTPRPDVLSVPPNPSYYDGLKEAETKFPIHPGNSIVGIADTISNVNNNGLDSAKQNYRPPTSWKTGTVVKHHGISHYNNKYADHSDQEDSIKDHDGNSDHHNHSIHDNLTGAASQEPSPTVQTTPEINNHNYQHTNVPTPSPILTPPNSKPFSQDFKPSLPDYTTESDSEEYDIDIRMKTSPEDPVYNFIKKFDPSSPNSHKTVMSRTEIIDLNKHLPNGQVSSEEDRTQVKNKGGNDFNKLNDNDKSFTEESKFDTVNLKPAPTESTPSIHDAASDSVPIPARDLLPPKKEFSDHPSTTMGPPVYYEWKWAVPAFDLEPPKPDNGTAIRTNETRTKNIRGRSPFSDVTRPTPVTVDPTPSNVEYNISSYFIPDYVFPLDNPHPGYEDEDAETSFQVKIGRKGRASFGENPACPQCHPAYLKPGSCEPCIVKR
ncbi:hypothetical protein ACJJTC_007357 [Scirpophaga incertulas]